MSKKAQIDIGAWDNCLEVCWTQGGNVLMIPINWILSLCGMGGASLPFTSQAIGGVVMGGVSLLMLATTYAISPLAFSSALIVLVIILSLMFRMK